MTLCLILLLLLKVNVTNGEKSIGICRSSITSWKNLIVNVESLFCIDNYFISISDYCCDWHVNDSIEVKRDCIRCLDELVDSILSETVVGMEMAQLSL